MRVTKAASAAAGLGKMRSMEAASLTTAALTLLCSALRRCSAAPAGSAAPSSCAGPSTSRTSMNIGRDAMYLCTPAVRQHLLQMLCQELCSAHQGAQCSCCSVSAPEQMLCVDARGNLDACLNLTLMSVSEPRGKCDMMRAHCDMAA